MRLTLTANYFAGSYLFHLLLALAIHAPSQQPPPPEPIRVKIVKVRPPKPRIEPQPKLQPKPRAEPVAKKFVANTPPAPIQGVSRESVVETGSFAVPVGNTMMISDTGVRLDPDQVVTRDLSRAAEVIANTVKTPEYTDDALDAEIEGRVSVAVFVTADGLVAEVELDQPLGFGMDERVKNAATQARFRPRLDTKGRAIDGWTQLIFILEIR